MSNLSRRNWLAVSGAALVAAGLPAQAAAGDEKWKKVSPRESIRKRFFPDVTLTTHEGKKVRFYEDLIKDKIVLINMMYATCEGVCPLITANLVKVQKLLGDRVGRDIFFYSITLKPETDTPMALMHHAHMLNIKPGWLFLTGAPADIELLRRKLGFVDPNPEVDKDKTNHIGNIRYGNEPLMLWAACPGSISAASIVDSIRTQVDWPTNTQASSEKGGRQ